MSFDVQLDPFENFLKVYSQAQKLISKDPNAMQLATVNHEARPSLRTVLYKGLVRGGFSFYTNYNSQKGKELAANPQASLLFYWRELDMQVRIDGVTDKLTDQESDEYFATRARISQIGAWASAQSETIRNHEELEKKHAELEKKFAKSKVPRPPYWGGYRVLPLKIEFWFSREGRLHERYVYERISLEAAWSTSMKSP